jgi:hypothetical protein
MPSQIVIPLSHIIEYRLSKIISTSSIYSTETIIDLDSGDQRETIFHLDPSDIQRISKCDKICYYLTDNKFWWRKSYHIMQYKRYNNVDSFIEDCEVRFKHDKYVFALLSLELAENNSIIVRGNFIKAKKDFTLPKLASRSDLIDEILT